MELLEKLPDVTVKGDGAGSVKHVSSGSAKQIKREKLEETLQSHSQPGGGRSTMPLKDTYLECESRPQDDDQGVSPTQESPEVGSHSQIEPSMPTQPSHAPSKRHSLASKRCEPLRIQTNTPESSAGGDVKCLQVWTSEGAVGDRVFRHRDETE